MMKHPNYCTLLADDGVLLLETPLDSFIWDPESNELTVRINDLRQPQHTTLDQVTRRRFLLVIDDPPERVLFDCWPARIRLTEAGLLRRAPLHPHQVPGWPGNGHRDPQDVDEQLWNFQFTTFCQVTHSEDPGFNKRFEIESRYARA